MSARSMSPDDAFAGASHGDDDAHTYYDRPLLKAPHWGWNVVTYLFLGGVMGGLGVIAGLCNERDEGDRRLQRTVRAASFALAAANPAILISHLGRPERFAHMLRTLNVKSPMSLGVWGLIAFSAAAGYSLLRKRSKLATLAHALLGAFIAGYTGVLLGATAVPLWGRGKRHIPALFVCSGTASACALAAMLSTVLRNHGVVRKLDRLEAVASLSEALLLLHFREHAAELGTPLFEGERGKRLCRATMIGGVAIPTALTVCANVVRLPHALDVARTLICGSFTLVGGYVLRESLIAAGKESACDPRAARVQPL